MLRESAQSERVGKYVSLALAFFAGMLVFYLAVPSSSSSSSAAKCDPATAPAARPHELVALQLKLKAAEDKIAQLSVSGSGGSSAKRTGECPPCAACTASDCESFCAPCEACPTCPANVCPTTPSTTSTSTPALPAPSAAVCSSRRVEVDVPAIRARYVQHFQAHRLAYEGCASHMPLATILSRFKDEISPGASSLDPRPYVLFDIGANVGAQGSEFLHAYGDFTEVAYTNRYSRDGVVCWADKTNVVAHLFEASKVIMKRLEKRATDDGWPIVTNPAQHPHFGAVYLHFNAGHSKSGDTLQFADCDGGALCEIGRLDQPGAEVSAQQRPKMYEIETMGVDDFLAKNPVHKIHFMKIDTEGHDPVVMKGMEQTLSRKIIDAFVFEYHSWWPPEYSLKQTSRWLSEKGYDTYLLGERNLILISGDYWDDVYERRVWSNCFVMRSDLPWKARFLDHVNLDLPLPFPYVAR